MLNVTMGGAFRAGAIFQGSMYKVHEQKAFSVDEAPRVCQDF